MVKGLSSEEAAKRLKEHGKNELEEEGGTTALDILLRRFKNVLMWILIVAATISFFADKMLTFYFVLVIILIIVVTGFVEEWKAEKAMEALKKMAAPKTKVYRDGKIVEKETKNVVPGDVLKLETGDKIPADAELLEVTNLKVDESILTGESETVKKEEGDEIYSGTVVSHGRCEARVAATGMDTELGEIAEEVQGEERKSPLQKKVHRLGKRLGIIAVVLTTMLFLVGLAEGEPIVEILMVTLALAVATVPEALPLTLTLTLSLGMKDMADKNAIVRKMLAVEGLGSTTIICTDKTGTLTENEMTVKKAYVDGKVLDVEGRGYEPEGSIKENGEVVHVDDSKALDWLIKTCALCNNAEMDFDGKVDIHGEPTEASLATLTEKTSYSYDKLRKKHPREEEVLFTSERKRMTTVNSMDDRDSRYAFMKGAPEVVLERCTHIIENGERKELTEERKEKILEKNDEFAAEALRVLGFSYRESMSEEIDKENVESDMTFVGLVGMMDPPREGVKEAVQMCEDAGIKVNMVTGDNKETARAIAKDIELTDEPKVVTGEEMDDMGDGELRDTIKNVHIFARTRPEDKLRIVEILQEHGEIVAMTGDGVNDAPAVKKADVGVGMGEKGTDVTKEASDMILQDDDFSTIVTAIKNGRRIYNNIEKFTTYLVSRNFTEIFIIALAIALLGFEFLPLIALQILFLNVIGQEFPALALGVDPPTKGIMRRSPRDPGQRLLHKRNLFFIASMALFMVAVGFLVFLQGNPTETLELSRTMVFATISVMIVVHSFNFRSLERSILEINLLKNKWILVAIATTTILVLLSIYVPFLQVIFEHVPLTLTQWSYAVGAALTTVVFIEVMKKLGKFIPKK